LNKKSEKFTINMYLKESRLESIYKYKSYVLPQGAEPHRTTERKEGKPGKACTNNH